MKIRQLMLAVAIVGLAAGADAGPIAPDRTIDIRFDKFCDGMHLVIDDLGIVTGKVTGCVTGDIVGTVGSNTASGAGITVRSRGFLYVIDDSPQRWRLFDPDERQSGTYTVGRPERMAGVQSATSTGR